MHITELPAEHFQGILAYLDLPDQHSLLLTCSTLFDKVVPVLYQSPFQTLAVFDGWHHALLSPVSIPANQNPSPGSATAHTNATRAITSGTWASSSPGASPGTSGSPHNSLLNNGRPLRGQTHAHAHAHGNHLSSSLSSVNSTSSSSASSNLTYNTTATTVAATSYRTTPGTVLVSTSPPSSSSNRRPVPPVSIPPTSSTIPTAAASPSSPSGAYAYYPTSVTSPYHPQSQSAVKSTQHSRSRSFSSDPHAVTFLSQQPLPPPQPQPQPQTQHLYRHSPSVHSKHPLSPSSSPTVPNTLESYPHLSRTSLFTATPQSPYPVQIVFGRQPTQRRLERQRQRAIRQLKLRKIAKLLQLLIACTTIQARLPALRYPGYGQQWNRAPCRTNYLKYYADHQGAGEIMIRGFHLLFADLVPWVDVEDGCLGDWDEEDEEDEEDEDEDDSGSHCGECCDCNEYRGIQEESEVDMVREEPLPWQEEYDQNEELNQRTVGSLNGLPSRISTSGSGNGKSISIVGRKKSSSTSIPSGSAAPIMLSRRKSDQVINRHSRVLQEHRQRRPSQPLIRSKPRRPLMMPLPALDKEAYKVLYQIQREFMTRSASKIKTLSVSVAHTIEHATTLVPQLGKMTRLELTDLEQEFRMDQVLEFIKWHRVMFGPVLKEVVLIERGAEVAEMTLNGFGNGSNPFSRQGSNNGGNSLFASPSINIPSSRNSVLAASPTSTSSPGMWSSPIVMAAANTPTSTTSATAMKMMMSTGYTRLLASNIMAIVDSVRGPTTIDARHWPDAILVLDRLGSAAMTATPPASPTTPSTNAMAAAASASTNISSPLPFSISAAAAAAIASSTVSSTPLPGLKTLLLSFQMPASEPMDGPMATAATSAAAAATAKRLVQFLDRCRNLEHLQAPIRRPDVFAWAAQEKRSAMICAPILKNSRTKVLPRMRRLSLEGPTMELIECARDAMVAFQDTLEDLTLFSRWKVWQPMSLEVESTMRNLRRLRLEGEISLYFSLASLRWCPALEELSLSSVRVASQEASSGHTGGNSGSGSGEHLGMGSGGGKHYYQAEQTFQPPPSPLAPTHYPSSRPQSTKESSQRSHSLTHSSRRRHQQPPQQQHSHSSTNLHQPHCQHRQQQDPGLGLLLYLRSREMDQLAMLSRLERLVLRGHWVMSDTVLRKIAEQCPRLKELSLDQTTGTTIGGLLLAVERMKNLRMLELRLDVVDLHLVRVSIKKLKWIKDVRLTSLRRENSK